MSLSVGVVLPTRNRCAALERTLRAVCMDHDLGEIIVVNDGSTDGTERVVDAAAARDDRILVVAGRGRGAATARQLGLESASADVVLFLDDDVVPRAGLAAGHRRHHEASEGRVVVGYMPTAEGAGRGVDDVPIYIYAHDYDAQVQRYEADPAAVLGDLWGGNVSLRRPDALMVGLDGPRSYAYHEDKDFGLRCTAAGLQGVFDRSLAADHHPLRPFASFLRLAHAQGMDLVRLHDAHPELGRLDVTQIGGDLPAIARPVLAASTVPVAGALELRALSVAVRLLSYAGARRLRNGAAVTARACAQRRGVRDALAYPDGIASSTERPSR